jgi:hypothetical protein
VETLPPSRVTSPWKWHVRTLPLVPVPVPRFSPTHIVQSESIPLYTLYTVTFVVTGVVTALLLIPLLIPATLIVPSLQ